MGAAMTRRVFSIAIDWPSPPRLRTHRCCGGARSLSRYFREYRGSPHDGDRHRRVAVIGPRPAGIVASASQRSGSISFSPVPMTDSPLVIGRTRDHDRDLRRRGARDRTRGPQPPTLAGREQFHGVRRHDSRRRLLASNSAPVTEIIDQTTNSLVQLLSLRACRFDRSLSDPPLAQIQSNGNVELVGLRWPLERSVYPDRKPK